MGRAPRARLCYESNVELRSAVSRMPTFISAPAGEGISGLLNKGSLFVCCQGETLFLSFRNICAHYEGLTVSDIKWRVAGASDNRPAGRLGRWPSQSDPGTCRGRWGLRVKRTVRLDDGGGQPVGGDVRTGPDDSDDGAYAQCEREDEHHCAQPAHRQVGGQEWQGHEPVEPKPGDR
jgi:hypothetical protein